MKQRSRCLQSYGKSKILQERYDLVRKDSKDTDIESMAGASQPSTWTGGHKEEFHLNLSFE